MSKIPTIEEFLKSKVETYFEEHKNSIKEYAELVREETLNLAAEEAEIKSEYYRKDEQYELFHKHKHDNFIGERVDNDGDVYAIDTYEINKQSILNLVNHKNLEIK